MGFFWRHGTGTTNEAIHIYNVWIYKYIHINEYKIQMSIITIKAYTSRLHGEFIQVYVACCQGSSTRHRGQVTLRDNQDRTQSSWNVCPAAQGNWSASCTRHRGVATTSVFGCRGVMDHLSWSVSVWRCLHVYIIIMYQIQIKHKYIMNTQSKHKI